MERILGWAGDVVRKEEGRNFLQISTGTGKIHLGILRRRWEDNVRMDLKIIGVNMRNWVVSAQSMDYWRALVNVALNLQAMELVI
jgi:hypothetical protein